jgi:hypothetical protein
VREVDAWINATDLGDGAKSNEVPWVSINNLPKEQYCKCNSPSFPRHSIEKLKILKKISNSIEKIY